MDPFQNSESSPALRNDNNNQNYSLNQTQNWNLPGLKNKSGNNTQEADIFPEILIGVFVGGVFIIIIVILYMAFRTQLKIILANRKWNKNNPEEKTDEVDTTTNLYVHFDIFYQKCVFFACGSITLKYLF